MKQKIKPILTILLFAFVGVTLAVQIVKEFRTAEPMLLAEGLNVVCTHATVRCPPCTTMERLTREMLDESFKDEVATGKIVFREVNYEQPEVDVFAGEFKVATASVVLVNVRNGEVIAGKNLANEAWKLYADVNLNVINDAMRGNSQTLRHPPDRTPGNPAPTPRPENPKTIQKITHAPSKINF